MYIKSTQVPSHEPWVTLNRSLILWLVQVNREFPWRLVIDELDQRTTFFLNKNGYWLFKIMFKGKNYVLFIKKTGFPEFKVTTTLWRWVAIGQCESAEKGNWTLFIFLLNLDRGERGEVSWGQMKSPKWQHWHIWLSFSRLCPYIVAYPKFVIVPNTSKSILFKFQSRPRAYEITLWGISHSKPPQQEHPDTCSLILKL